MHCAHCDEGGFQTGVTMEDGIEQVYSPVLKVEEPKHCIDPNTEIKTVTTDDVPYWHYNVTPLNENTPTIEVLHNRQNALKDYVWEIKYTQDAIKRDISSIKGDIEFLTDNLERVTAAAHVNTLYREYRQSIVGPDQFQKRFFDPNGGDVWPAVAWEGDIKTPKYLHWGGDQTYYWTDEKIQVVKHHPSLRPQHGERTDEPKSNKPICCDGNKTSLL